MLFRSPEIQKYIENVVLDFKHTNAANIAALDDTLAAEIEDSEPIESDEMTDIDTSEPATE